MIDANLDKISWLPDHVIDQILSHLPIKEAAKTSVLSSKWSNKWYTLPNLVFDKERVSLDSRIITSKFLKLVDRVLLLHYGPIKKFEIHEFDDVIGVNHATDIDRWVFHLIRRSIEEFVLNLNFIENRLYKIPRLLFSCQSLHHLELNCCELKPPTTFEGFRNLKSLELTNSTMSQDGFEKLISKSPLLEKLILCGLNGVRQINIHGPNLKVFHFNGDFEDFSFDNTSQLVELRLDVDDGGRCSIDMVQFFAHLPHIKSLLMTTYFLQCLIAGDVPVPVKLSTPCINLRSLDIYIRFDNLKQISAALCLLKSSPNLRELEILSLNGPDDLLTDNYCWENMFSEPTVSIQVRHVTIYAASGFKLESDFIKFLLLYSPMLKTMIVRPSEDVKSELEIELSQFKRASKQAEVMYGDTF